MSMLNLVNATLSRMDLRLTGHPIEVRYRAGLRDTRGNPAHASAFVRARLIVLASELKRQPAEHRRILLHELFHFAWVRLGNEKRTSWEKLLESEIPLAVRGETGWSAEWRKAALAARDVRLRTRRWRDYACESFCDTGALVLSGVESERTLAARPLAKRRLWFKHLLYRDVPI